MLYQTVRPSFPVVLFSATLILSLLDRSGHAEQPNVVVILCDDLGWGDVSHHDGRWRTDNIDRLFTQGCELTRFYVHPICSPTRISLMTGKNANTEYGVVDAVNIRQSEFELPDNADTLGELFRDRGYETRFVGKWHMGRRSPVHHGFDVLRVLYGPGARYFSRDGVGGVIDWYTGEEDWEGESVIEDGYTTELIGDQAVAALEAAEPESPLFLLASFTAIHKPLQAQEKWLEKVGAGANPSNQQVTGAMILALDHEIGRIVDAVPANTLVFFTSDNGPRIYASAGNLRGDKGDLWEGGIRVPTAVWWPGRIASGIRHDALQSDSDLLAACARLTSQADLPPNVRPTDFFPPTSYHRVNHKTGARCVVENQSAAHRYKLIVDYPAFGDKFLFDLSANPRELEANNLWQAKPQIRERLLKQLPPRL